MAAKQVVQGVYLVSLGFVNVFLLEDDGLVLIDTGIASSAAPILSAVRELGYQEQDVRHILITHLHGDHTGGLAEIKRRTGAQVYMHPADAALVEQGVAGRPARPGPGLLSQLMFRLMMSRPGEMHVPPAQVDHELQDGQILDFAGDLRVIHTPGHTAGHVSLLWPGQDGVLFVGDAATAMLHLGYGPIYEDLDQGKRTLAEVSTLDFQTACFSHGKPLVGGASAHFKRKFGAPA